MDDIRNRPSFTSDQGYELDILELGTLRAVKVTAPAWKVRSPIRGRSKRQEE